MSENVSSTAGSETAATPADSAVDAPETGTGIDAPDNPAGDGIDGPQDQADIDPRDVRWRERGQQAEARLAVEQARVSEINRRDAERLAAVALEDAGDLWVGGTEIADVLGDDGLVDPGKLDAAIEQVLTDHPHWARRKPVVGVPARVVSDFAVPIPASPSTPSWAALLKGQAG